MAAVFSLKSVVCFIMNDYLINFVLAQKNSVAEGIVQLLFVILIIVSILIKNLFAAKQENQKQNQKENKLGPHSSFPSKTSASAEKARIQRERKERLEHILEGILSPKRPPQRSSVPVPAKPRVAVSNSVPVNVSSGTKVFTDNSTMSEPYREMSESVRKAESDTIMDTNAIRIDTRLQDIPQLQEEHIQEDQSHLIFRDKPKTTKYSEHKSSDMLYAFSDSDDLRKAILYTEILGRPVSLRQSQALFD